MAPSSAPSCSFASTSAEEDKMERLAVAALEHGLDGDRHQLDAAFIFIKWHIRLDHGALPIHRLTQGGAKLQPQAAPRHGQQLAARGSRRWLEEPARPGRVIHDIAIDHDMGWGEAFEDLCFNGLAQRITGLSKLFPPRWKCGRPNFANQVGQARPGPKMLPGLKDALFLIDEREEIAMLTDPPRTFRGTGNRRDAGNSEMWE